MTATAFVYGSAPTAYHVQLHCELGRPSGRSRAHTTGWIFSLCTCPVRNMCKHGAAVALSIREGHTSGDRVPEWERRLGTLVEDLSRTADREVERFPLALQFTLDERRVYSYRHEGPRLGIRPLRPGAKQAWIRSGADWSDIPGAVLARSLLPEQADAIGAPAHRAEPAPRLPRRRHHPHARSVRPAPAAPAARRRGRGRRAGAGVAADRGHHPREAGRSGGRNHQRRRAGATDPRRRRRRRAVARRSGAAHGPQPGGRPARRRPPADRRARTRRPHRRTPAHRGRPARGAGERSRALRGRLAALLRHLSIRSPDGSVDVPAPIRPTLLVSVVWRSATAADLTWEWRYDDAHRCGLDAHDLLEGLRDRQAESAVRATVSADLLGRRSVQRRRRALARHPRPAAPARAPRRRGHRAAPTRLPRGDLGPRDQLRGRRARGRGRRSHRLARPRGDGQRRGRADPAARRDRRADPRPRVPGAAERALHHHRPAGVRPAARGGGGRRRAPGARGRPDRRRHPRPRVVGAARRDRHRRRPGRGVGRAGPGAPRPRRDPAARAARR